ncbi:MAG TPA: carboxypeptidase regulatory-like domain-containing protein, partial [Gemmatimonadaceae bacterium]|nr:carboxypeptidase regulatory-like domain-containing protein [Gemmatimonadaceae bacterium]
QGVTVAGVVVDTAGQPLPAVEVVLPGSAARTMTDDAGRFRLAGLPAGSLVLRARRIGYRLTNVPLETAKLPAEVRVTLRAIPLELSPVMVQAALGGFARDLYGFYERKGRGLGGRYITRADLERVRSQRLTDALRALVPGAQVTRRNSFVNTIRFRGSRCPPLVWIDGSPALSGEFDIDVINPETISGMEVYSGVATVPAEFRTARGVEACGVIAIWSRNDRADLALVREREQQQKRRNAEAKGDTGLVLHADEVDTPAKPLDDELVEPVYPDSLLAYGITGKVVAEFVVEPTGLVNPLSVTMVSASSPEFFVAVRNALIASKFTPARKDGKPVRQVMLLPFEFG